MKNSPQRPLRRDGVINPAAIFLGVSMLMGVVAQAGDWQQWRGPFNTGMTVGDAPLHWNDNSNVTWKVAMGTHGANRHAARSYHRTYGSFASNSPLTDGERVFAFFG